MNRKSRRALKATEVKIQSAGSWEHFNAETGPDERALFMLILRLAIAQLEAAEGWSDREVFQSLMNLIECDYLDIHVRMDDEGIAVRPELKVSGIGTFQEYCKANLSGSIQ